MSNYTKSTDFASKDSLPSGNSGKIVKGTEIDTEFNNIATAIATKADTASPAFTGNPTAPTPSVGDDDTSIATTAFVQAAIAAGVAAAKAALYPVGSIYTNATSSTNPATLLGFGTWAAFGAGRVMVGFNASDPLFDTAEETGGSKDAVTVSHTHTASTSTAGSHTHGAWSNSTGQAETARAFGSSTALSVAAESDTSTGYRTTLQGANTNAFSTEGDHTHTITVDSSGSSGTNANLQPYITVYMWKRTA